MNAARAGLLYFLLVFALGLLLGTFRVLWLAPRLGETPSVAVELPLMLTASWFICRRLVQRLGVPATAGARIGMGGIAFVLLIAAEILLGLTLFGRTLQAVAVGFLTAPGLLGLTGQLGFAVMPLLQMRRRR